MDQDDVANCVCSALTKMKYSNFEERFCFIYTLKRKDVTEYY